MKIAKKKLGILGGMGPNASCNWYKIVLELCQKKFKLTQDYEYPEIYVISLQMDGWSEKGIEDFELVRKKLTDGINKLNNLSVDYIVIACNTAHYFFNELSQKSDAKILNMIDLCCEYIFYKGINRIGVLSSATTNEFNIYYDYINSKGLKEVGREKINQTDIDKAILLVQSGDYLGGESILQENVNILMNEGAEIVILGCTELPLIDIRMDEYIVDPGYLVLNKVVDLLYE